MTDTARWDVKAGSFLAREEHAPKDLVRQARLAEDAGFEGLWIPTTSIPGSASIRPADRARAEEFFSFYASEVLPRLRTELGP